MIPSHTVWEMRGRGDNPYIIYGGVWRNANDERTYVAGVEENSAWGRCGALVHDIKFRFKTRRAAVAWVKRQKAVVRAKIRAVKRRDAARDEGRK